MKKYLIVLFFLFAVSFVYSQDREKKINQIRVGMSIYPDFEFNTWFTDNYGDFYHGREDAFNIDVFLDTKYKNVNWLIGTSFIPGKATNYIFNGGGIYAGINTKFGTEMIGLDLSFAPGIFSYKQIVSTGEVYQEQGTHGLGAFASVGVYFKYKWIGIAPNVRTIYSGSSATSLTLLGFNFPVTINF